MKLVTMVIILWSLAEGATWTCIVPATEEQPSCQKWASEKLRTPSSRGSYIGGREGGRGREREREREAEGGEGGGGEKEGGGEGEGVCKRKWRGLVGLC